MLYRWVATAREPPCDPSAPGEPASRYCVFDCGLVTKVWVVRDHQAEHDAAAWQKVLDAMRQWANWQKFDGTPEQQITAADARDFACDGAPHKLNNMVWTAIAAALKAGGAND